MLERCQIANSYQFSSLSMKHRIMVFDFWQHRTVLKESDWLMQTFFSFLHRLSYLEPSIVKFYTFICQKKNASFNRKLQFDEMK